MALLTKEQWKKKQKKKRFIIKLVLFFLLLIPLLLIGSTLLSHTRIFSPNKISNITTLSGISVEEMYLTPNKYSRPQDPLYEVKNIVVHYTGNPGTTAESNRNYFENLKTTQTTSASSHYVVGLEGEIIQCLPLNEISYATNHRNNDTISIETSHPDATGKFNDKTYNSLVALVSNLVKEYKLDVDDVIRHFDVTGKKCPLYYVDNQNAWETFKEDVASYMKNNF